jgi:hypothetical protein
MASIRKAREETPREDQFTDAGRIRSTDEAEHQERQLSVRIDLFLRARGWTHTCRTPGAHWLWTKTIDGTGYFVSRGFALSIERAVEEEAKTKGDRG